MPDCELMPTCPFFNSDSQQAPEMSAGLKEEYCRDKYTWCGRYMAFKVLDREKKRTVEAFAEDVT